jgi:hypothetical protein
MTREELAALHPGDRIVRDDEEGGIVHGVVIERGEREIYVAWAPRDEVGIINSTVDNPRIRRE